MNDEPALTEDEAQEAADLITTMLTTFPMLVSTITDESANLIARGLALQEAALDRRATYLPLMGAVGLPTDGGDEPTRRANIAICRKVLELRQAVREAVAANAAAAAAQVTMSENRRRIAAMVGLGEQ